MKKINFRYLFYPFLAFLLGLNSARKIFAGEIDYILVISLLVLVVGGFCIFKKHFKRLAILLCALVLGTGYYFIGLCEFNVKEYEGSVAVVGRVSDNITENDYSCTVILNNVKIDGESAANVSVKITNCYDLEVGSIIAFESELTSAKAFTLDRFNSSCYRNGVRYYATCNYAKAVVSDGWKNLNESVRQSVLITLEHNMSSENALTAYACLFGSKNNLDDEIYSAYQGAGIIHILTVSGLHVSFLISLVFGFLKLCKVNKYVRFAITTIFIIFYAYLCGFSPSVMRAGIMGVVFMISKLCQRRYDGLNSLGLAGFALCLFRPLNGLDVGFLMSVFCVAGIFVIMPVLSRVFAKFLPKKVGDVFAVSIAAQIGIFPMLCMMEGGLNILSIFANFLIVPFFAIVFPLLFVLCILSLIMPFMSGALVVVDYAFSFILMIAKFFALGPMINLQRLDFPKILLFYSAFFVVSDYFMALGKEKLIVFTSVLLSYSLAIVCYYFKPNDLSTISYISQYSQSSVVLHNSQGNVLIVGDSLLLDRLDVDNAVFVETESLTQRRVNDLSSQGASKFVGCKQSSCSEGEIFLPEKDYVVAGFEVTYLANGEDICGVRVNFDNLEIFIASNQNLGYNEFEKLQSKFDFDFVIANYALPEGEFVHISTEKVEGCDYSSKEFGNMAFDINKTLRRLD